MTGDKPVPSSWRATADARRHCHWSGAPEEGGSPGIRGRAFSTSNQSGKSTPSRRSPWLRGFAGPLQSDADRAIDLHSRSARPDTARRPTGDQHTATHAFSRRSLRFGLRRRRNPALRSGERVVGDSCAGHGLGGRSSTTGGDRPATESAPPHRLHPPAWEGSGRAGRPCSPAAATPGRPHTAPVSTTPRTACEVAPGWSVTVLGTPRCDAGLPIWRPFRADGPYAGVAVQRAGLAPDVAELQLVVGSAGGADAFNRRPDFSAGGATTRYRRGREPTHPRLPMRRM